jgi:Uma2 family endonuclease
VSTRRVTAPPRDAALTVRAHRPDHATMASAGDPMPATATAYLSAEEYLLLSNDEPSELVHGEIRPMSPARWGHGHIATRAFLLLRAFVEPRGLGMCMPDNIGFRLSPAGAKRGVVRSPDAAFVRAERLPADGVPLDWVPGAPDLAVEVLSPSDTASELQEKLDDYFDAGSAVVWVIDPRRRTVEVHAPVAPVRRLREHDLLGGAPVLPDFRCAVADLFEGLAPAADGAADGNAARPGA